MELLLDLDRYPLHQPDRVSARETRARARTQLLDTGITALPGFVRPAAAQRMAAEALARRERMAFAAVTHNIYQEEKVDPAFAPDHPRNRELVSACRCLPFDQIQEGASLRRVYEWEPMTRFIAAIVHGEGEGPSPLFRFADPLGALTVNVVEEGQEIAWHFDQAQFVVILLLQNAVEGGAYEVAPESRWLADGAPDYPLHRRVLDDEEPSVLRHRFDDGALLIHRGTRSLHRVASVHGDVPRVSALLAYAERPDAALTPEVRLAYYGRAEAETTPR